MSMVTLISRSPEETLALGEQWGREAQRGWIIGLDGELGAGKTQLVRGIARGLGSSARVHSPTFTLLNEYSGGRCRLFHIDLFRLSHREEVAGAGLEEYLTNPDGITVVEWMTRWSGPDHQRPNVGSRSSQTRTRMAFIESIGEMERRITYEDSGA